MPEVTPDESSGLCITVQFIFMLILFMTFEPMKNLMEVSGIFFFFSACSTLGFFFMVFFIKETRGLTDLQKKALFSPPKHAQNK